MRQANNTRTGFTAAFGMWWRSGLLAKCCVAAGTLLSFAAIGLSIFVAALIKEASRPAPIAWQDNVLPYYQPHLAVHADEFQQRLWSKVEAMRDSLQEAGYSFAQNIPLDHDSIEVKCFQQENGLILLYVDYLLDCGCDSSLGRFWLRRYVVNPNDMTFELAADDLRPWERYIPQFLTRKPDVVAGL
ncbi:MAG: hypothetical protein NDJ18_04260 [candidate division Zixibacteria bacterium]|nr:hypothetical protein [candidate division Zixibacteria bacterium]